MATSETSPRPLPNSYWVVPGRFLAGEYPGASSNAEARAKLRALLESGITHFVDLTEAHELRPYSGLLHKEAQRLGVTAVHLRHPILDVSIPQAPEEMTAILDAIDDALAADGAVYVHCWGGVGRTGTTVGCWLVRHGRTGDTALAQLAEWWQVVEKAYRRPETPETDQQVAYVRTWREPA